MNDPPRFACQRATALDWYEGVLTPTSVIIRTLSNCCTDALGGGSTRWVRGTLLTHLYVDG